MLLLSLLYSTLYSTASAVGVIKAIATVAVPSTLVVTELQFFMASPFGHIDSHSATDDPDKAESRTPLANNGAKAVPIA
ncbi:hypothetical protein [Bradyrhizobium valentinum]|uniref:hypothetical protein n=1 Tax=Bradyrhizobium valentinum TaxID=1518501 RepID=UPI0018D255AD|nr:hypothetical protein [Bradyrhizobium valentinum]